MFKYMEESPSSTKTTNLPIFNIPPPRNNRNPNLIGVETNFNSKRKTIEKEYNKLLKRLKSIDDELRELETKNPQLLHNPNYVDSSAILNYRIKKAKNKAEKLKENQQILSFNPNNFLNLKQQPNENI